MSKEMNMYEAAMKMQTWIAENVGILEKDKKLKDISYDFREAGRDYEIKLVRKKKTK